MKGLYITRKDQSLDQATQDSGELCLIAKKDNIEIMKQFILKDKNFVVYPAEGNETIEFFYILQGEILLEDDNVILSVGDSFYLNSLEGSAIFKAITDVQILYMINESIFHVLSNEIQNTTETIRKVNDKDMYTRDHSIRVQEYSFLIAKIMKLKGERLECLQFASLFHDLGKIKISNEILNKPGKLTNEEFDIIKTHSYHGSIIVKDLYFKSLDKIILQHHERLDGSGYPNGLAGDEILLEASIISVADTYDAMTTDRPYRKALSNEVAAQELIDFKNIHYREDVVDAFIEILRNSGEIKD